jgi:hypothetical protein
MNSVTKYKVYKRLKRLQSSLNMSRYNLVKYIIQLCNVNVYIYKQKMSRG